LLINIAQKLPGEQWYTISTVQVGWLITAVLIALGVTLWEIKTRFYPVGAILSPTKLYHNFLLYGGYGFVVTFLVVTCGWALFMGKLDVDTIILYLAAIFVAGVWVGFNILDGIEGFMGQMSQSKKAELAHIDKWWERWPRFLGFIK
jgi:hypothetical protein